MTDTTSPRHNRTRSSARIKKVIDRRGADEPKGARKDQVDDLVKRHFN